MGRSQKAAWCRTSLSATTLGSPHRAAKSAANGTATASFWSLTPATLCCWARSREADPLDRRRYPIQNMPEVSLSEKT